MLGSIYIPCCMDPQGNMNSYFGFAVIISTLGFFFFPITRLSLLLLICIRFGFIRAAELKRNNVQRSRRDVEKNDLPLL